MLPRLNKVGADAATRIDAAARLEDEIGNHPRLQRYSGIGERTESIVFHPAHDEIGRMGLRTHLDVLLEVKDRYGKGPISGVDGRWCD